MVKTTGFAATMRAINDVLYKRERDRGQARGTAHRQTVQLRRKAEAAYGKQADVAIADIAGVMLARLKAGREFEDVAGMSSGKLVKLARKIGQKEL